KRCIREAVAAAGIRAEDLDAINGHLTATSMDPAEVLNWSDALERKEGIFPFINSLKGLTGHCLSAAGSVECVSSVLQVYKDFVFGNINSEDLHPEIASVAGRQKVPLRTMEVQVNSLAKASFGFGDVNAVAIFQKYRT